ncbi:C6 finger domain protein [Coniochaeta ligniaria NRRL 30616]|uniref:C6 finger domain protein n=1 Tax=Coniochaeta ligniaria NRRL 30616 TaxID=1408157 RepID=A0A1J7ICP7_9PEZI|nr:C6 finger domain protein [Coniochaeta ligniaria NRRL 30616]
MPAYRRRNQSVPRKSRAGCRNCKLRKLKCDEGRPQCQRCSAYGVLCNFTSSGIPDLHPSGESQSFALKSSRQANRLAKPSLRPSLGKDFWATDATTSFTVDAKSRELLSVYKTQSVHMQDDTPWQGLKDELVGLAFIHPFLMHGILALAAGYCRSLTTELPSRGSSRELYHVAQCTSLFRERLVSPVRPGDKDALWGTASTLGIVAFSSLDTTSATESWPLKASSASDLEWIHMGEGKMVVWHMADPLRPESLFSGVASTYAQMHAPLPSAGTDGIPPRLAQLCKLDESSTAESSPFLTVSHAISKLYSLSESDLTTGRVLPFLTHMPGSFKLLLYAKDPIALTLLYLWYSRARLAVWWIDLRARVECPAILLYLKQYHPDNMLIHEFLA